MEKLADGAESRAPLKTKGRFPFFAFARDLRRLLGTGQSLWPYAAVR
jgi:hypothetical protein